MDIEVVPDRVRLAGQAMGEAAYGVGRVTPYDDLSEVGTALPGSTTAAAAEALAARWRVAMANWARATEVHGEALAVGAEDYRALESAVVGLLALTPPNPRPIHHRDSRAAGGAAA